MAYLLGQEQRQEAPETLAPEGRHMSVDEPLAKMQKMLSERTCRGFAAKFLLRHIFI